MKRGKDFVPAEVRESSEQESRRRERRRALFLFDGNARAATAMEFADWLTGYLKAGNKITGIFSGDMPEYYIIKQDSEIPELHHEQALRVIVSPGVNMRSSDMGHNAVFFMDGYKMKNAAGTVPLYRDVLLEMESDMLPRIREDILPLAKEQIQRYQEKILGCLERAGGLAKGSDEDRRRLQWEISCCESQKTAHKVIEGIPDSLLNAADKKKIAWMIDATDWGGRSTIIDIMERRGHPINEVFEYKAETPPPSKAASGK